MDIVNANTTKPPKTNVLSSNHTKMALSNFWMKKSFNGAGCNHGAPVRTLRVVVGSAAPPGTPVVRVSLSVR